MLRARGGDVETPATSTIVAAGTPEEVARVPESYTGRYLQKALAEDHGQDTACVDE